MRQIILDTETTGLEPKQGHRIIEIGCVEMVNRRLTGNHYHQYLQPDRDIDLGAIEVHGITNEFLEDKPRFKDVATEFLDFIRGAELVIHNAPFDIGFIRHEMMLFDRSLEDVEVMCPVLDTLAMARKMRPGKKNSLDALCSHFGIDNTQRTLHGALLDAEILAEVYLVMTGGQSALFGDPNAAASDGAQTIIKRVAADRPKLKVITASSDELKIHEAYLDQVEKANDGQCVWRSKGE